MPSVCLAAWTRHLQNMTACLGCKALSQNVSLHLSISVASRYVFCSSIAQWWEATIMPPRKHSDKEILSASFSTKPATVQQVGSQHVSTRDEASETGTLMTLSELRDMIWLLRSLIVMWVMAAAWPCSMCTYQHNTRTAVKACTTSHCCLNSLMAQHGTSIGTVSMLYQQFSEDIYPYL